jgi:ATP-dependent DNA ligase
LIDLRWLSTVISQRELQLVKVTPTYYSVEEKELFWERVKFSGVEGAVSKHLDSHYLPGMRSKQWVKHKLVKAAEAVVMKAERTFKPNSTVVHKGSADLGVYRDGQLVKIGSASLIGKDLTIEPGDVVEFEYLYFTGSAPIQPRITRKRFDKEPEECTFEQFPAYTRREV